MNYRILSLLLLSIIIQSHCNAMENHTKTTNNQLSRVLFDEYHRPIPALLQLLKETDIPHNGTLDSIFAATQKHWLRPAGKERWEIQNNFTPVSKNLPQLFKRLSLINKIKPSQKHYNYALLLGDGDATTMRIRLASLIKIWNKGIRFDSIYIPTGTHPLDKRVAPRHTLLHSKVTAFPFKKNWQLHGNLPTTETEMIKLFFDQADLPAEWNNIPIVFVNTPMQSTVKGTLRRPTTLDTINKWLTLHNPQPGSILAISIQPYVGYQDSVLRDILAPSFTIETIGNTHALDQLVPIILDSLARWIYHEYRMHKAAKY